MSRRRNTVPHERFFVFVPQLLADRLRLICTDPTTGRLKHGKRSKLITNLIAELLYKNNLITEIELEENKKEEERD